MCPPQAEGAQQVEGVDVVAFTAEASTILGARKESPRVWFQEVCGAEVHLAAILGCILEALLEVAGPTATLAVDEVALAFLPTHPVASRK